MSENIRVRFAPSPTGFLHVGGLRTALFNYLHAKSSDGKIILRIEDTDRSRYVDGALDNLLNVFQWLGLEFDEGPDFGGDFGPYIQSERLDIYRHHIDQLLKSGKAYYCFCTAGRLEEMRKSQQSSGQTPMYDRKCRHIPLSEAQERAETEEHVIRMAMPLDGAIQFRDGVRGVVKFECSQVDDQVLLKSDGYPTYHLANVVDDHLMGISDVIRGEEWLTSTPKHVQLYEFFGWDKPVFHHLSLLLNPDRSKLSKRQGDVAVEDYRARGYLPEALINYTALLGWHSETDREFYSLGELVAEFSLERVSKAGAVFDLDKLNWLNKEHIKNLETEEYLKTARDFIPDNFNAVSDRGRAILIAVRDRIDKFTDIPEELTSFSGERAIPAGGEAFEMISGDDFSRLAEAISNNLDKTETWDEDSFKSLMKQSGKDSGVKGKFLWMPVRIALTGSVHGPDLALIAVSLGKNKFRALIEETAEAVK